MQWVVTYGPSVLAVVLVVLFRRSWVARLIAVGLLCFWATMHWTSLTVAHRIVLQKGYAESGGEELPAGYEAAVRNIQKYSRGQTGPFEAMVAAFVCLSLLPMRPRQQVSKLETDPEARAGHTQSPTTRS